MVSQRNTGPDTSPSTTTNAPITDRVSDSKSLPCAVAKTVMAEQVTSHVVNEAQSMARPASIDDTASATNSRAVNGDLPSGSATAQTTSPVALSTNANVSIGCAS